MNIPDPNKYFDWYWFSMLMIGIMNILMLIEIFKR